MNSPLNKSASESVCWNFKLIAHHELDGFGRGELGVPRELGEVGNVAFLAPAGSAAQTRKRLFRNRSFRGRTSPPPDA